eukprot:COSAG01_NODE_19102_length_1030_cov_56.296455_1_plen_190_part_00
MAHSEATAQHAYPRGTSQKAPCGAEGHRRRCTWPTNRALTWRAPPRRLLGPHHAQVSVFGVRQESRYRSEPSPRGGRGVGLWWGGPGVGPTGARRMAWTASDAGAGLWRRLPVGMGWPGTAAPITAVRCVWGIELSRQTGSGPAKIEALLNLRTADWLVRALRHRRRNDGKQPPVVRGHLDLSASTAAR